MSALRQTNSGAQWTEPVTTSGSVAASMEELQFVEDPPGLLTPEPLSGGLPRAAAFVDWHGDRLAYEALRLDSPYVLVNVAGVIRPQPSGAPAAIIVEDGVGGLVATTDLTQTPAGAFFPGPRGRVILARFDAPKMGFVQIGDRVRMFPTS